MKKLTFQQPTGFHQDFIKTCHGIVGKCGAAMAMKHGWLENCSFTGWWFGWFIRGKILKSIYKWIMPEIPPAIGSTVYSIFIGLTNVIFPYIGNLFPN